MVNIKEIILPVGFGRVNEYKQTVSGCLGAKLNNITS